MHIPDGYLSPKTCIAFFAGMAPFWYLASSRAGGALRARQLPLLALAGSFTFVIMMFNFPIPGGSSGHIIGSATVAMLLGPWAAVAVVSLTVALQSFLFGDGGILALGVNAFNMAVIMSFAGYYSYRLFSFGNPGKGRRFFASAIGGYVSVTIAALAVALELGIQPLIAHDPAGLPLYAPYPLSVTMPAMLLPHILFIGPIEAIGTGLMVSYIAGREQGLLYKPAGGGISPLWLIVAALIILTPIGLLTTGSPWGEWGKEEFVSLIGFVPQGMDRLQGLWKGLLPGYSLPGLGNEAWGVFVYIVSAASGSALIVGIIYFWARLWRR
ncbi:MAG: cobalt transporter CbiM [Deltaproteobacteria bacterium]|nr:cobalt transporter CbiM [Deltaproteobacteria bacterium]